MSNPEAAEVGFVGTVGLELGHKGRAGLRKAKRRGDDFPSVSVSPFKFKEQRLNRITSERREVTVQCKTTWGSRKCRKWSQQPHSLV